jgi:hypothetical protein
MRGAFVVQLASQTKPLEGHFEGSVEEVDSGIELRFHSTAELVRFLGERFALASAGKAHTEGSGHTPIERDD